MEMNPLLAVFRDELSEDISERVFQKMRQKGMPHKILLTPEEAAWSLGFSESAFHQAEWSKEIHVVKVGVKNFYRAKDLETFADNHIVQRIRKPPKRKAA